MAIDELLRRAQESLANGRFPEARAAADEAFALDATDPRSRELYGNVYLAHGIRLSGEARERRRKEIEARGTPGESFEDSEAGAAAFR